MILKMWGEKGERNILQRKHIEQKYHNGFHHLFKIQFCIKCMKQLCKGSGKLFPLEFMGKVYFKK